MCDGAKTAHETPSEPVVNKTALGWVIYGAPSAQGFVTATISEPDDDDHREMASSKFDELIYNLVKEQMSIKSYGISKSSQSQDIVLQKQVQDTIERTMKLIDGRYEIGLF